MPQKTSSGEENFGKCTLVSVSNFFRDPSKISSEGESLTGVVKKEHVQLVHYPDAQQLIFHMPKYAWDAGRICLKDESTGATLEEASVREKLNGGTMIVWDTLPLDPGRYVLEADWPDGWTHQICFEKGDPVSKAEIPAIDLVSMGRVEYSQQGRGGTIFYHHGDRHIRFDWEFAGGNGVVIIFVPKPEHWEAHTRTPLSQRLEILEFVARQVVRDKAPSCTYRISDNFIDILK